MNLIHVSAHYIYFILQMPAIRDEGRMINMYEYYVGGILHLSESVITSPVQYDSALTLHCSFIVFTEVFYH